MSDTESESLYHDLEKMTTRQLLDSISREDQKVPLAVAAALPQLEALVNAAAEKMQQGGRLFYLGAGTSGRLGILDASECPPTFGVAPEMVTGLIAGGDKAIRNAVEGAEDNPEQGWQDLLHENISAKDFVVGIAASGRTPYVLSALKQCAENGIKTGCIVCSGNSPIAKAVPFPVEIIVGPEFVTGSTRMKAGTAQKLALNMISTTIMIRLGRVEGNRMVHMQLSNKKLVQRGTQMVMEKTGLSEKEAQSLLLRHGSVKNACDAYFLRS